MRGSFLILTIFLYVTTICSDIFLYETDKHVLTIHQSSFRK